MLTTNVAFSQDLSFTAVSTDTDCSNSNHCVDIQVQGFTNIATFQFGIFYDETLLEYVSESNIFSPTAEIEDDGNGEIRVSWVDLAGATFSDNVAVINLCFQPTGVTGTTVIELGENPLTIPAEAATVGFSRFFTLDTDYFLNDATFDITDSENPTIVCPTDTMLSGAAPLMVSDIDPVMFGDNCLVDMLNYSITGMTSGSGMNDASGTTFESGLNTVTYTVSDGAGNMASCDFDVTIDDNSVSDTTFTFIPETFVDCENGNVELCVSVKNADSTNSIGVYFTWDETQIDYLSRDIILPGSSVFSDAFVNTGVAGFIWNDSGIAGGVDIPDGDSLFCVQYAILSSLDTPIINITDLAFL